MNQFRKVPSFWGWCAANTPGYRVPSHGTDQLGQRYAYDFFQIDWKRKGYKFYKTPIIKSLIFGVNLKDTYCWSPPIYAPFDGNVIDVKDGLEERNPVHVVRDLAVVIKNGFIFGAKNHSDLHPVLGNYIILEKEGGIYCLIAHARKGSIKVEEGQYVREGQGLGQVGHFGNSTAPHLHFQLMNTDELLEAEGIPCCLKSYKTYENSGWVSAENGIPEKRVRIHV